MFLFSNRTSIPYLVYKTDDNAIGEAASIYMRRVEEDGHTFQEGSEPVLIITADQETDYNIVEGIWPYTLCQSYSIQILYHVRSLAVLSCSILLHDLLC